MKTTQEAIRKKKKKTMGGNNSGFWVVKILLDGSMLITSLVAQMVKSCLQCGRPGFDP